MNDALVTQYAIYEHPSDYPEGFVVREWYVTSEGAEPGPAQQAKTLEEARSLLPEGATKVEEGRTPNEPQIIEVWM
jgi:hypothetical protein